MVNELGLQTIVSEYDSHWMPKKIFIIYVCPTVQLKTSTANTGWFVLYYWRLLSNLWHFLDELITEWCASVPKILWTTLLWFWIQFCFPVALPRLKNPVWKEKRTHTFSKSISIKLNTNNLIQDLNSVNFIFFDNNY